MICPEVLEGVQATVHPDCRCARSDNGLLFLFSAVRTAWPATRSAHSFLEFRTYPLNVLPAGFSRAQAHGDSLVRRVTGNVRTGTHFPDGMRSARPQIHPFLVWLPYRSVVQIRANLTQKGAYFQSRCVSLNVIRSKTAK